MATASFVPTFPPNSQSPGFGAQDIRDLTQNILFLFGFTVGVAQTMGNPFSFADVSAQSAGLLSLVGDPTADLGIATKQYVDRRVAYATVTGTDLYSGTVTGLTAYSQNSLYLIKNNGTANTGAVMVNLGPGTVNVVRVNGTPLNIAGEWFAGGYFLLAYDATNTVFVNIAFDGLLPANPTVDLGAATKQYVDTTFRVPTRTPLNNSPDPVINVPPGQLVGIGPVAITLPDAGPYLLFTEYMVGVGIGTNSPGDIVPTSWIGDGTNLWAFNSPYTSPNNPCLLTSCGISPVSYTTSPINVSLNVLNSDNNNDFNLERTPTKAPAQTSYLSISLVRAHA